MLMPSLSYMLDETVLSSSERDQFFSAAVNEINLTMIDKSTLDMALYVLHAKCIDASIAGIAGIRKSNRLPALFVTVREEYQGKGIGSALTKRVVEVALNKYGFLTLSTYDEPCYEGAIALYKKMGFKEIYRSDKKVWMAISKGLYGNTIITLIRAIYPLIMTLRKKNNS